MPGLGLTRQEMREGGKGYIENWKSCMTVRNDLDHSLLSPWASLRACGVIPAQARRLACGLESILSPQSLRD
jgi:hypothetical protein